MLKIVSIFMAVLFFGGAQSAEAGLLPLTCDKVLDLQLQKLSESLLDTEKRINQLDVKRSKGRFDYLIDQGTATAIELLNHSGIRWRFHEKTRRILVIEPDAKGVKLNQMAAQASKNLKGLRIEFDLRQWRHQEAIFYDESANRIVIDAEILKSNDLTPPLYHELRHAYNQILFYQGHFDTFSGNLDLYSRKMNFNYLYTDGFSLDEMLTYPEETYRMMKLWNENESSLEESDLADIKFNVKMGKSLLGWVDRISSQTKKHLNEVLENLDSLEKFDQALVHEGKNYPMRVFQQKGPKQIQVEIFDNQQKNLDGQLQYVTSVIIKHGKFGSSFFFPEARKTKSDKQWIQMSLNRVQFIQERISQANELWNQLIVAFGSRDSKRCLDLSQQIQNLVQTPETQFEVEGTLF